jgi:hypothetical protein
MKKNYKIGLFPLRKHTEFVPNADFFNIFFILRTKAINTLFGQNGKALNTVHIAYLPQ